jgi:PAS domain-containing protein
MNEPVVAMESILESVAQPVWVVDHDGNVVFVNPAGLADRGLGPAVQALASQPPLR